MPSDAEAGAAPQRSRPHPAWGALVAGLMVQLCTGNIYIFATYSERYKEVLFTGDDQAQRKLQILGLITSCAGFFPISGFFYDADVRIRGVRVIGGPCATTVVGAIFTFTGYFLTHRIATGWNPGFAAAAVIGCISGHGASYYNVASVTTGVKNLAMHRGIAVGLLKALLGLAGALITQVLFAVFADDDGRGYLLFVALFCSVLALVAAPLMQETEEPVPESRDATRRFVLSYTLVFILAFLQLGGSLSRAIVGGELSQGVELTLLGVSALLVVLVCVSVLVRTVRDEGYEALPEPAAPSRRSQRQSIVSELPSNTGIDGIPPEQGGELPETDRDERPAVAMKRLSFWCLFFGFMVGAGAGNMILGNAAQIAKAKGGDSAEQAVLASMLYIWSSIGRLSLSALGEWMHQRGFPRAVILAITYLLHGGGNLVMSIPGKGAMYAGASLAGFSYGGIQAVFPPVVSELYGVRHFASNYMFLLVSSVGGILIYSVLISTAVFEAHQELDDSLDSSTYGDYICIGNSCYFLTHIIIACSCLLSFFITMYVAYHTQKRRRLAVPPRSSTPLAAQLPLDEWKQDKRTLSPETKNPSPQESLPRA